MPADEVQATAAERVREEDREVLALQRTPPPLHRVEDRTVPGPHGPLPVRLYLPTPAPHRTVLFLHGGGFVAGREGYDAPLRELAYSSGCLIASPECRLAPEHRFPAAVEDATAVARWLAAESSLSAQAFGQLGIAGDSSGGNLAAIVTHQLTREGRAPSFQVLIYPMLDATTSSQSYADFATGHGFTADKSRWYFEQYLSPAVDRRSPRVSPLFERNLADVPRTLVVTAECDPLRDDGERYARKLAEAGVPVQIWRYPGTRHGFFQLTGALESSRQLHRDLGKWLSQQHPSPQPHQANSKGSTTR
jgi:acetyl esterase